MTKTYSCSHCFSNVGFSHGDGTVRAPWSNQQQFAEGVQRGSIAIWDGGFLRGILVKPGLPCLKVEVESGESEKFWQKKFEILPWLKSLLLTNGNCNPKVKVIYFSKGCCLKVQALKNGCKQIVFLELGGGGGGKGSGEGGQREWGRGHGALGGGEVSVSFYKHQGHPLLLSTETSSKFHHALCHNNKIFCFTQLESRCNFKNGQGC